MENSSHRLANHSTNQHLARYIVAIVASVICVLCFVYSNTASADVRMRVIVKDSNVYTDTYQPLRCSHIFMYEGTVAAFEYGITQEESERRWKENEDYLATLINQYGFNCIRVGVWHYRLYGEDQAGGFIPGSQNTDNWRVFSERAQSMVERYVDAADRLGFYVILNDHSPFDTPLRNDVQYNDNTETIVVNGLDNAKRFWDIYATKYAERTNVLFEITNEPNPDAGDHANMVDLYRHVRGLANDTHIIAWSYNVTSVLNTAILDQYAGPNGIDYSNASVGFHTYELEGLKAWEDAWDWQQAGYPVIATEFQGYRDYSLETPGDLPHYLNNLAQAERLGVSWAGWMYEASIQSKYSASTQTQYPENFRAIAPEYGVDTAGWEIDNRRAASGSAPLVAINIDTSKAFLNSAIDLAVQSSNTQKVYYYSGNQLLGESSAAPDFAFKWTSPRVGRHKITARAESREGMYYRSAPKTIAVYNDTGIAFENEGFETGTQSWIGGRAGIQSVSDQGSNTDSALRFFKPESFPITDGTGRYGVNLDIKHYLRAFGPGTYQLDYSIRTDKGTRNIKPKIFTPDSEISIRFIEREMASDWRSYSDQITIEYGPGSRPAYLNFRPDDNEDFYLDDVSFRKVSPVITPTVEADIPPTEQLVIPTPTPAPIPTPTPTPTPTPILTSTPRPSPTTTSTQAPTASPEPVVIPTISTTEPVQPVPTARPTATPLIAIVTPPTIVTPTLTPTSVTTSLPPAEAMNDVADAPPSTSSSDSLEGSLEGSSGGGSLRLWFLISLLLLLFYRQLSASTKRQ